MDFSRRGLLHSMGAISALSTAGILTARAAQAAGPPCCATDLSVPADLEHAVRDEALWSRVRAAYAPLNAPVNFNNAGLSPQTKAVEEAFFNRHRYVNALPDMHTGELGNSRSSVKQPLAAFLGCSPGELMLNRNATEGLCTVIGGMEFTPGDEIVVNRWDYQSILHACLEKARRSGARVKWVADFSLPASNDEILTKYRSALKGRPKLVIVTQMLQHTGQILPVTEICRMAGESGAQTLVDAAQSVAQMPVHFQLIGCDYLACSLHKWLCAPFGTGALIIRKDRLSSLSPLLAPYGEPAEPIEKFDDALGTYDYAAEAGIVDALQFHLALGTDLVGRRLHYLKRQWVDEVARLQKVEVLTPPEADRSVGYATFGIRRVPGKTIRAALLDRHGFITRTQVCGNINAVRVSPHIYSSVDEIHRFVEAVQDVASRT